MTYIHNMYVLCFFFFPDLTLKLCIDVYLICNKLLFT